MRNTTLALSACAVLGVSASAVGSDASDCDHVGFANVEWTGESLMTDTAAMLLEELGYETKVTSASVQIAFESVASGERDAFLGLWLPTQESMVRPYLDDGEAEKLVTNLEGAKYTLAVPQYVYDAGVTDFSDLNEHADRFGSEIYGLESGNDGNVIIEEMISDGAYDLSDWSLVESSEAAMLAQVRRATNREEWVVFLGWAPHPMNRNIEMEYLTGGEDYFGPDQGGATVHTLITAGYAEQCPNVARFLEQFTVSVEERNEGEAYVMDDEMSNREAARALIESRPELLERWLEGVSTRDGEDDALEVVRQSLGI